MMFEDFKRSPQSALYDHVYNLNFERFSIQDLVKIREQARDSKKCLFIGGRREPHWYDQGASVSYQFKQLMELCRQQQIYNADFFVPSFGDMYQNDFRIMNNNHFGWNFIRYDIDLPFMNNDIVRSNWDGSHGLSLDKVKYNFLYMNFTHRMHRQLFSKFLIDKDMLNKNCVAINIGHPDNNIRRRLSENMLDTQSCVPIGQNDEWHQSNRLKDLWRDTELKAHRNPDIGNDTHLSQYDFAKKSGVYIVTETVFNHPYPWFSEKTTSALLSGRPFVIIGAEGSLLELKKKGYKTFDDIFDESYDKISDPSARLEAIFELVSGINKKTLDEIKKNVLQCSDKTIYNRKLMLNTINRYKKYLNKPQMESANDS